jgi:hypothetical protein
MGERKTTKISTRKRADKKALALDTTQIATRAYERFLARGATHGHDVDDWLAAEQELRGH